MFRGNIAATLLKIVVKNHYSVKCYDKSNMNVITCTLSLWENCRWGLIYLDQFTFFRTGDKNSIGPLVITSEI